MELQPFCLNECEQFFRLNGFALSRYDITQAYMAVGGIPYYLGYFEKTLSVAQNIQAIFQDPAYFTMRLEWKEDEGWIFREQYLSGFLPEKLKAAEQMERRFPGKFGENIRTLKKLIEKDGPSAGQMEITLGSPFVPCDIYASLDHTGFAVRAV